MAADHCRVDRQLHRPAQTLCGLFPLPSPRATRRTVAVLVQPGDLDRPLRRVTGPAATDLSRRPAAEPAVVVAGGPVGFAALLGAIASLDPASTAPLPN